MALRDLAELTPDEAEALDDLVNDFFCIVWIGHFDDLAAGDDPLARTLREELRSETGTADDPAPLTSDEIDDFVELVQAYGDPE